MNMEISLLDVLSRLKLLKMIEFINEKDMNYDGNGLF